MLPKAKSRENVLFYSESADIFYIDYGNTEVATLDKICAEFPPIVKSVPPMAMRCCLAGVKPVSKDFFLLILMTGLKVVLLFPTFSYFFVLFLLFSYFFLKSSYYSYFSSVKCQNDDWCKEKQR